MNERELERALSVVDDIEPAPPDLVARVWSEIEATFTGDDAQPHVQITRTPARRLRRSRPLLLVAATMIVVVGAALVTLRSPEVEAPATVPDVSAPTIPAVAPVSLEEACARFVGRAGAFEDVETAVLDGAPTAAETVATAVAALGDLIDDVDRLAPDTSQRELDQLRIMRGALNTAGAHLRANDPAMARDSVGVARAAADQLASIGARPLDSCLG